MKNFLQEGTILNVVAPATVVSGDFVVVGAFFGVAQTDAASGALVPIVREGIFTLPKATGTAWTAGDQLYWDSGAAKFTKTAAGNKAIGIAAADAASGDATGAVSLEEVPTGIVNAVAGVGAGYKVARGETALDGTNPTPVATGLATVIAFTATLKGTAAPGVGTSVLTANIAGAAGNVDVYAWKPTSNADPTLVASAGTESFYWTAIGT